MLAEVQQAEGRDAHAPLHGDGDGDDTELLVRFIWHLGCVAGARGAGVDHVMRGLIQQALTNFAEEYNAEE